MDAIAQLALMSKLKLVFEEDNTFLSFPAITPLSYSPDALSFTEISSPSKVQACSEFSRITNSSPGGIIFQPDSQTLLWNVYGDILQTAHLAQGTLTVEQQAELAAANSVVYIKDAQGKNTDSPAVSAYKECQQAYLAALQAYKVQQLTASTSTDTKVQDEWKNISEPLANSQLVAAASAWQAVGFKAQVDLARSVITSIGALSPQIKWQHWVDQYNPDIAFLTDTSNEKFAPVIYLPANIIDQKNWPCFSLNAPEIQQLASQATRQLTDVLPAEPGTSVVDSLSFEYCSVLLERPWFDAAIFEVNFWTFPDPTKQLSDGGDTPSGVWPSYIKAAIFARNIVETVHSQSGPPDRRQPTTIFPQAPIHTTPVPSHPQPPPPPPVQVHPPPPPPTQVHPPPPPPTQVHPPPPPPTQVHPPPPPPTQVHPPPPPPTQVHPPPPPLVQVHPPPPPPVQVHPESQPVHPGTVEIHPASVTAQPITPTTQQVPFQNTSSKSTTETSAPGQVSIVAFICQRLPKCPNPDLSLIWGPETT